MCVCTCEDPQWSVVTQNKAGVPIESRFISVLFNSLSMYRPGLSGASLLLGGTPVFPASLQVRDSYPHNHIPSAWEKEEVGELCTTQEFHALAGPKAGV